MPKYDGLEGVDVAEYDLLWSLAEEAGTGLGWYIKETPSGRESQRFATRAEALAALEGGLLVFAQV